MRPKGERPGEAQPMPGVERREMGNVTRNLLKSMYKYGLSRRAYVERGRKYGIMAHHHDIEVSWCAWWLLRGSRAWVHSVSRKDRKSRTAARHL